MRAITLYEPWATGIAVGRKKVETRSWGHFHRGPIAIHASKKWNNELKAEWERLFGVTLPARPNLGCVVAVARLVDCRYMDERTIRDVSELERAWGDWRVQRFAWMLEDIRPLRTPIPARGAQGVWNWDAPLNLAEQLG